MFESAPQLGSGSKRTQIVTQLTANRAIFTRRDIRPALNESDLEGAQHEALAEAVVHHLDALASVGAEGRGHGWTTRQAHEEETAILDDIALKVRQATIKKHKTRMLPAAACPRNNRLRDGAVNRLKYKIFSLRVVWRTFNAMPSPCQGSLTFQKIRVLGKFVSELRAVKISRV
jgi:hypothetical protein